MSGVSEGSGSSWSEVSDAVAEAFGRRPREHRSPFDARASEAADRGVEAARADDSVARAFGRTAPRDEALLRELQEAGYTPGGARGVLQWLDDGFGVDTALSASPGAFDPQKVPTLVESRGRLVLERHGRAAAPQARPEGASRASQVDEAQQRLEAAYMKAWPTARPDMAARYAKSATEAWLESGARRGLSVDQIAEAIDAQARDEGRKATEARRKVTERRHTPGPLTGPLARPGAIRRTVKEAGR